MQNIPVRGGRIVDAIPQLVQRIKLFAGTQVSVELHHRSVPYKSPEKPGIKVSQVTLVASSFTVGRLPRPVAEGYHTPLMQVRVI